MDVDDACLMINSSVVASRPNPPPPFDRASYGDPRLVRGCPAYSVFSGRVFHVHSGPVCGKDQVYASREPRHERNQTFSRAQRGENLRVERSSASSSTGSVLTLADVGVRTF